MLYLLLLHNFIVMNYWYLKSVQFSSFIFIFLFFSFSRLPFSDSFYDFPSFIILPCFSFLYFSISIPLSFHPSLSLFLPYLLPSYCFRQTTTLTDHSYYWKTMITKIEKSQPNNAINDNHLLVDLENQKKKLYITNVRTHKR